MNLLSVQNQYLNFFPPQHLTICSVITTNWLIKPQESGFPEELIYAAYDNCNGLPVKQTIAKTGKIRVTYISNPGESEELFFVVRIISLFNKMPSIQRTIFCCGKHIAFLKQMANEGIEFVSREEHKILDTDIILCFGSSAIHFLLLGLPVIIFGTYGLGGYVTPENFERLLKKGFMGRPGGAYNEEIPLELLAEEILKIRNSNLFHKDAKRLKSIIKKKKILDYDTLYKHLDAFGIDKLLNDIKRKWELDMQLASNIQILSKASKTFLIRKNINDVVASFEEEETLFFKYLIDRRTAHEAFKKAEISISNFWQMIAVLWDKKIIILYGKY